VVERGLEDGHRLPRERHHARISILRLVEPHYPPLEIHLLLPPRQDLPLAHPGKKCDPHHPSEHRVAVRIQDLEDLLLLVRVEPAVAAFGG